MLQVERCVLFVCSRNFLESCGEGQKKSYGNKTACNFSIVLVIQAEAGKFKQYQPIADV